MELMTDEIRAALLAAHGQERLAKDTPIVVKFFTPDAQCTWFITDALEDPDHDLLLFGFCDLGDREMAELGYVSLNELRAVRGKLGLEVERDLHYPETKLSEVLHSYGKYYETFKY